MNEIVRVRGLAKSFAGRPVLRGVDLSLRKAEVVGFLGPNGAGKSTCLRILTGLVFRDAGEVSVHGSDPAGDGLAIRRQTSYLPGETSVYAQMRGGEFLEFAASFYPRLLLELRDRMLAEFELPLARKVRTYSAGMKQKLALVAALQADVELYVLDEPDRALDTSSRLILRDHLKELSVLGKTILLSSHHLAEMEELAHRLVFLVQGCIVSDQRVLRARERLRGEVRVLLRDSGPLPDGAESAERMPNGGWRVRVAGDPLAWARRLEPARVQALELGATRLERLYQVLAEEEPTP